MEFQRAVTAMDIETSTQIRGSYWLSDASFDKIGDASALWRLCVIDAHSSK